MAPDRSLTRVPWAPLVAAAIVVPTVLAGLTLLWPRHQIESTLTSAGTAALAAAGVPGAAVSFSGRDGTITGVAAAQAAQAVATVEAATGVRIAQVPDLAAPGGPAAATAAPAVAGPFGIARQAGSIVLTGAVASDDVKAGLVAAATAQAGGRTVVDQLTVSPGATLASGVDATSVGALAAALAAAPADLSASVGTAGVTLTGTVASDAAKAAAAAAVGAALPGVTVDDELTVSAATPSGSVTLDAAAKQALQSRIAALIAGLPITFGPDSPQLTAQGQATVAQVLAAVKAAPGARLQIDGYVATGPGNGILTAQQLSADRAATVMSALVAGGVPAADLTATGRGESGAGSVARRVVITVV